MTDLGKIFGNLATLKQSLKILNSINIVYSVYVKYKLGVSNIGNPTNNIVY